MSLRRSMVQWSTASRGTVEPQDKLAVGQKSSECRRSAVVPTASLFIRSIFEGREGVTE